MLRKSLSKETKDLIKNVLKSDANKRYTIQQILDHPAIKNNIKEFESCLSEQDFSILFRNYMLNSDTEGKRIVPDSFENLVHLTKSPLRPQIDL